MAIGPFSRRLPRLVEGVAAGLYRVGNEILNESQERVPVDTGTLKGSGRVLLPELEGDELRVVVGYGYGDQTHPSSGEHPAGYGFIVHETHPTKAKFLEGPALEKARDLGPEIAVSIRRTVRTELGVKRGLAHFTEELTGDE